MIKNIKRFLQFSIISSALLMPINVMSEENVEVIELDSISTPKQESTATKDVAEYEVSNEAGVDVAKNRRDAERLLMEAFYTLQDFKSQKNYSEIERDLRKARAVLIFPDVINAGLMVGISGGKGVLLARSRDGKWSYPTFYNYNQASFGLQIGADNSKIAMFVMNGKGLGALIADSVQVGATVKGAAGEQGESLGVSTTSNFSNDIKSYAISKGAFIGASIESASIKPDENLNKAYYGRDDATTQTVIIDGMYSNKHADAFRKYLNKFTYQYTD